MNVYEDALAPDAYEHQVRRMASLRGYPRGEDDELIRVARQSGVNADVLCDVITDFIDHDGLPQPADLKRALESRRPVEVKPKCPKCNGLRFVFVRCRDRNGQAYEAATMCECHAGYTKASQ